MGHIFIMSVLNFQRPHYKVICPPIFLKGDFPTFLSSPGTRTVTARFSVDSLVCVGSTVGFLCIVESDEWMNEHFRMNNTHITHSYVHFAKPLTVGMEVHPLSTTWPIILSTHSSSFTVGLKRGSHVRHCHSAWHAYFITNWIWY